MNRNIVTLGICLSFQIMLLGQSTDIVLQNIAWQDWSELSEAKSSKKTMVYVYTDWCTLCKKVETGAFQDSATIAFINENFVPLKLNAESKSVLTFQGEEYNYVRQEKVAYHQLAAKLLDGKLGFPSIVFLDESQNIIQSFPGYQGVDQLLALLNYFGLNHYRSIPWTTFQRSFMGKRLAEKR